VPRGRILSPIAGGSTLITFAPCAAIVIAAREQVIMLDNSITSIPANGWLAVGFVILPPPIVIK
jgi:hypothetical protein